MKKVTLEMPLVTQCSAGDCAYNIDANCHARAITVGDSTHPGCDTFFVGMRHTRQAKLLAGIGACKMGNCEFNDDLECVAENVKIGLSKHEANCMTFSAR